MSNTGEIECNKQKKHPAFLELKGFNLLKGDTKK